MSSRGATTSQPAFAMVCGSITFFLFGVMDHSAEWRRPGAGKEGAKIFPRMAVERNTGLTPQRSHVHCRLELKLNGERRPCARTSSKPSGKLAALRSTAG